MLISSSSSSTGLTWSDLLINRPIRQTQKCRTHSSSSELRGVDDWLAGIFSPAAIVDCYESTKVERELKLNRTVVRWMCRINVNERKKSEELREHLRLEPVSVMIKKSRLRWFGHVERKDDNDWVKRCITWEVEGIRQSGRPKKTWWDCVKK